MNIKLVLIISVLFAFFDKLWFTVPIASKIYNDTVKDVQGTEINPSGKKFYGVIAYLIMGLVYHKLIYPTLGSDDWQITSIYYSLAVWGVFNLTNIVIFKNYSKEMLIIDVSWGLVVTQIIGFILKEKFMN